VADRTVSVPMTLSDLEMRDGIGHIFKWISLITFVWWNDCVDGRETVGEIPQCPYRMMF